MDETIKWLLAGPAWVRYRCMLDLLEMQPDDAQVNTTRTELLADAQVRALIADVSQWETKTLSRHNDANHPIHKLVFLADIGLTGQDAAIAEILPAILRHRSDDRPFQVLSNYPVAFGGSGKEEWLWCLCDAPSVLYALLKMGLRDEPQVASAVDYLAQLSRENGWPCKADSRMPKFKGPGKAGDPCPYANLLMLKLLAVFPEDGDMPAVKPGLQSALQLWENSRDQHPFLFKMGNDFRKLKVPFVWYDILHMAEVISLYPQSRQDPRFIEMLSVIESKADASGRYTSESIWTKWSGWEFCQKREPSRWVTLCALRILKRAGRWKNPQPCAGSQIS